MKPEIIKIIDEKIKELKPKEDNIWIIYGECKKVITNNYEQFLPVNEYNDYIKYITNKLSI